MILIGILWGSKLGKFPDLASVIRFDFCGVWDFEDKGRSERGKLVCDNMCQMMRKYLNKIYFRGVISREL